MAPGSKRYPVPGARHRVEDEILRSRFITTLAPAATIEEAQAFVAEMRAEFEDATHNCWAFLVGEPGSSGRVGCSDDGEPHGTAGRPMLNVLSHCEVGDIVAVVTRYYGGTKLGKGGLVRAYSGGVNLALETLPKVEKVFYQRLTVVIEYGVVTMFQRLAAEHEVQTEHEEYAADVTYQLLAPDDQVESFVAALESLTNGAALVSFED